MKNKPNQDTCQCGHERVFHRNARKYCLECDCKAFTPASPQGKEDTCPTCDGLGYIFQGIKGKVKFPCPTCGGSGRIPRADTEQPIKNSLTHGDKSPRAEGESERLCEHGLRFRGSIVAHEHIDAEAGDPLPLVANLQEPPASPPSPDALEIDDIILLTMEAGRELAKEYEKYDGDMDWSAFVAKYYPEAKAAITKLIREAYEKGHSDAVMEAIQARNQDGETKQWLS